MWLQTVESGRQGVVFRIQTQGAGGVLPSPQALEGSLPASSCSWWHSLATSLHSLPACVPSMDKSPCLPFSKGHLSLDLGTTSSTQVDVILRPFSTPAENFFPKKDRMPRSKVVRVWVCLGAKLQPLPTGITPRFYLWVM